MKNINENPNENEGSLFDDHCEISVTEPKNDPWKPLVANNPLSGFPITQLGRTMKSSEEHVATLEAKIKKLKGHNKEPCAKDLLDSLSAIRVDSASHIPLSAESFFWEDTLDEDSALSQIQRKLHPERQAITTDELLHLVEFDQLQSTAQQLDSLNSEKQQTENPG